VQPQSINRIFIYITAIEKYYFVEQRDFLFIDCMERSCNLSDCLSKLLFILSTIIGELQIIIRFLIILPAKGIISIRFITVLSVLCERIMRRVETCLFHGSDRRVINRREARFNRRVRLW